MVVKGRLFDGMDKETETAAWTDAGKQAASKPEKGSGQCSMDRLLSEFYKISTYRESFVLYRCRFTNAMQWNMREACMHPPNASSV